MAVVEEGPVTSPTSLLERERELAALERAIGATLAGDASIVLIEGPAGIGKSRLVAEARRRAAHAGLRVLSARGSEHEQDFPFGVVRQLFEPNLSSRAVRDRVLAGAAAAAAPVFGLSEGLADETSGEHTFASLHGLYWLTVNLSADTPLLLAVDDLHWSDRTSLRFLGYLTRRLDGLPVLLVAGLRPAEVVADKPLLAEITGEPAAQKLQPGPLSAGASAELVQQRLGQQSDAAFAQACHTSTQGNPLLLSELLKTLDAEHVQPDAAHVEMVAELGPRAVSRAVLLRLARLSQAAVSVARWLAVMGGEADTAIVGQLAGLDGDSIAEAARQLVRAEIVRPEPPLEFVHPLVLAAVYRDLAPGERELSHARAAQLLLRSAAPPEQIAAHLLAMPRHGEQWVADVLRSAARAAFAKGAPDAAISSLQRALVEPLSSDVRTEILFELGRAQALMSLPDSVEPLRQAYESAGDPEVRGHAADWLACSLNYLEAPDEAANIARRTISELPPELADLGRQLEATELYSLFFGARDEDGRLLERLRARRTIDTGLGPGARMIAAVAALEWAQSAGPAEQVVRLARAALESDTLARADAGYLVSAAILPLALADLDEATERWAGARKEAHRSGFVYTDSAVQLWSGYTLLLRGELAEAEAELRGALSTARLWGYPTQSPWETAILAELLIERGAPADARRLLDDAGRPPRGSDAAVLLDRAQIRLLLAEGNNQAALTQADVLADGAGWRRQPRYVPWRSLKAQALDRLGRVNEAVELAAEELEIAREWGSPGTVGRSLRVLGVIERDAGMEHLEEACALLEEAPARLEQAKALTALGEALRRTRRPTEAREPLRRALELAEICGATALARRARAEIQATGARPRRVALQGVGSLTSSERRVAELAAEGMTNRDIAQTLYVTPKTVEVHLSSAYRKLNIDSRHELSRVLLPSA